MSGHAPGQLAVTVLVYADTDGYVAMLPEIPGCIGTGSTIHAALIEVAEAWLQHNPQDPDGEHEQAQAHEPRDEDVRDDPR